MRYQTFGRRTGLRVSELALGTSNFGMHAPSIGQDVSREIFEAFVEAGGTTFDMSDIYQSGQAETMLGELLGARRGDFVLITKYSGTRDLSPPPGTTGNSRKNMIRSVEASLRRLQTDYLDVFMPHFPDGVTPIEEILDGLDVLTRSGKILHGGLSNFPAWRVAGAAVLADERGQAPLVGIETEYSLAERSADRELLPMADAHGLGVLLYSPLAGGLLTGKYRSGGQGRLSARGTVERDAQQTEVLDTVIAIADETGTTPVQIALAWLRHRAETASTALIPILGPRSITHLQEYLRSLEVALDPAQCDRLTTAGAVAPGTPHEDVQAALAHGFDGDRTLLKTPPIPVT